MCAGANFWRTKMRLAAENCCRKATLAASLFIALAIAATSRFGTSSPDRPFSNSSAGPPQSEAISGTP